MHRAFYSLICFAATFLAGSSTASAVTIEWSPVGNVGNANDPATGNLYGGVGYNYNIGTKDVTASQYVDFLNAKDADGLNLLGLYNSNMSDVTLGGISFDGLNPAGSMYGVISGRGDHPANYTTWYDAIRFANWLNNGQGSGDTETGAYSLFGNSATPSNGLSITRNAGATIFLPSQNEWYKAAYNIPNTSSYFRYGTSSNTVPTPTGPTSTPNSANNNDAVGNPTDVGAYAGTTSPYGAFDMAGNVLQWNEALIGSSFRSLRGGSYDFSPNTMRSNFGYSSEPADEFEDYGFRVASIPEPSAGVLAVIAYCTMWWWRKRFK